MKALVSTLQFPKRILISAILFLPVLLMAEGSWPKEIKTARSTVIMYQPQPDSMKGDHLYSRAAISFTNAGNTTPVFGAVWTDSRFSTDRESGICSIYGVKILNVRFPGVDTIDPVKVQNFKNILSEEATSWHLEFGLDELKSTLALNQAAAGKSANFKNDPPEIIYVKENSALLLFDGDPVFKEIENTGLKRAVNTPFMVLQDMNDRNYYLYGAGYWYRSTDPVKAAWRNISDPPAGVSGYFAEIQKQADNTDVIPQRTEPGPSGGKLTGIPKIITRTKPSELIQSQGEPRFAAIQGTQILYVTNTDDNIFMTIDKNQYYILISGRWYRSAAMTGPWSFIDSDELPPDFANIPEGSDKDMVLASIAGTDASKDAVMDAQIPQTAAVDRKTARCEVNYDGDPVFEKIRGTRLARGMNTGSTVLLYQDTYYVCDNAIWFTGSTPAGPWEVATSIPGEIQNIPPDDPSYNVKYVYIYDVQPDVVYVGYTPGYTGCYVYGPTVVYGTGWFYSPFYGSYYYPRPLTYGFCMHYNPWFGWSMGFSRSPAWFYYGYGGPRYHGGWWGPPMYRPPYHRPYDHYYGARPPAYRGGHNAIRNNNRTNIYNRRSDGSAKPVRQPSVQPRQVPNDRTVNKQTVVNDRTRPGNNPNTRQSKPPDQAAGRKNNVYTDRKGDVYRNDNGNWQKNNGKTWESAQPKVQERNAPQPKPQERTVRQPKPQERTAQPPRQQERNSGFNRQEMDRQNSARQRGTQNTNNRSTMQRSAPASKGAGAKTGGGEGRKR